MENFQALLSSFEILNINPIYLVCIIFGTTLFKSFDIKNKFKQGYVLFPLLTSLVIFLVEWPIVLQTYFVDAIVHAAIGAYGYTVYSKLFKRKKGE